MYYTENGETQWMWRKKGHGLCFFCSREVDEWAVRSWMTRKRDGVGFNRTVCLIKACKDLESHHCHAWGAQRQEIRRAGGKSWSQGKREPWPWTCCSGQGGVIPLEIRQWSWHCSRPGVSTSCTASSYHQPCAGRVKEAEINVTRMTRKLGPKDLGWLSLQIDGMPKENEE